jgi:Aspartyl protease
MRRLVASTLFVLFLFICMAFTCVAYAEVPMTWDSTGHAVVQTFVNGKGPFDFIFDTGADESAVYAWFAKSQNLPKSSNKELTGATGSVDITATRLSSLSLDGHAISDVEVDTVPDRLDGAKLAGVAGIDLMKGRLAVLDFGCGTAALLPLETVPREIFGKNATLIQAGSIKDGEQLTLPVTVNGASGVAVLDSGARLTQINYKFAAAAKLAPESAEFRDGEPTRGATMKAINVRIGPIGTVVFAGITRPDAVARVGDLPYLEGAGLANAPAMNLGLDLLRGTRLTVDYSSRRFWLAGSSCALPSTKTEH